jgi:transcription elongation factor Elf1
MNKNELKYNKSGMCPRCGGENLEYAEVDLIDQFAFAMYECGDCGFKGIEWYTISFSEHTAR